MNLKLRDIYEIPWCISGMEINISRSRITCAGITSPSRHVWDNTKRSACPGHMKDQQPMIAVNKDPDLQQVFSELLLIGNVFTPSGLENEQQRLREILEKCGFTLVCSECTILENNKIGDSVVTIARYSLEYRETNDVRGKTMYLEGRLAMQVEKNGRMSISISAKPGISPPGIDTSNAEGSLFGNHSKFVPFLSIHPA
jgi:hypothetical protein